MVLCRPQLSRCACLLHPAASCCCAAGELPATFGVPGVQKYCYFMKEVEDTVGLRKRISECFELASLPGSSEEERRGVLNFVVVGGEQQGPLLLPLMPLVPLVPPGPGPGPGPNDLLARALRAQGGVLV